jgi:hypothetical protein
LGLKSNMDILIPSKQQSVVIDATMLTNLMKCSRYTQFKHDLCLQPLKGKSNSLEIGSIIHKFLEVYYGHQMKGIGRSQAFGFGMAAAELYIQGCPHCTNFVGEGKPECGHPINEYPGLSNTPADSENYVVGWKFALQTCDEYAKHYQSDFWVTLDVETVRTKVLYEDDEIRIAFKSKLDWIVDTNNGIFPCDHKTMKQNRDTLSINNQFMGQCLQMSTRNVFINKIGLQKTLKPVDKFIRVPVSYSAARLMEWQSYILPYWCKQLLAYNIQEHYPPNFTSCESKFGKCEFYDVCESDPDMRDEIIKMNFFKGQEWNPTNNEAD